MELRLKRKVWLQRKEQQQLRRKNRMNGSNMSNTMRADRQSFVRVAHSSFLLHGIQKIERPSSAGEQY